MSSPIIKWVGGKRQLLPVITKMMPKRYGTYYEPFFGGGALFFDLQPRKAIINDFNPQLIGMYKEVQTSLPTVKHKLNEYQDRYNAMPTDKERSDYYYSLREQFNCKICKNVSDAEMAALLIFLNKAGFNGLYRVSKSGKYNVPPAHRKRLSLYDDANLTAGSKALQKATILCGDFENVLTTAKQGDFVFIDSPYFDTFDNYQSGGFTKEDHERLAKIFKTLSDNHVKCMLTNSNTDFIKNLYRNYHIKIVPVKRMVNSDAANRTGEEIIVTNYTTRGGGSNG